MRRSVTSRVVGAAGVAVLVVLGGCGSAPREATDAELAPVDQDANGQAVALGKSPKKNERAGPAPAAPAAPAAPRDEGPIVTLIYVTEIRDKGRDRPAAVIFTSDPESEYLQGEKPRPSRVLKPTLGSNMVKLLDALRQEGLDTLPSEAEALEADIGRGRQVIVVRDGRRVAYRQAACKADATAFRTFNRIERVLVRYSQGDATFVETEGLAPIPGKQ